MYFLSPFFGFLFQPVLGVMSDRCESRFGRRRPFILVLSISSLIGGTLILNSYLIGNWLGDANFRMAYIAIVLVGLGVTLLDFSADSTDSPLRAFLLDVCNPDDQDTALNIHAILGGTGIFNASWFNFIFVFSDFRFLLGLQNVQNYVISKFCVLSRRILAKKNVFKNFLLKCGGWSLGKFGYKANKT